MNLLVFIYKLFSFSPSFPLSPLFCLYLPLSNFPLPFICFLFSSLLSPNPSTFLSTILFFASIFVVFFNSSLYLPLINPLLFSLYHLSSLVFAHFSLPFLHQILFDPFTSFIVSPLSPNTEKRK